MNMMVMIFIISVFQISGSEYSENTKINFNSDIVSVQAVQQEILQTGDNPIATNSMHEQQPRQISGSVRDVSGQPIPGVNVVIKGTTIGTITDLNGNFRLDAPSNAQTLMFSFIGMKNIEVDITGQSTLSIVMEEETVGIDEIVVVGYGTQRKVTLTGSIVAIRGEEISRSPVVNVSNSLAGLLPGVIAMNRSGEPGRDDALVLIRGRSTTGDTNPLIVVDGIQDYPGWQRINPNDIESISVLKDASAAIYGARAANGVILITTKRGRTGKPTINYSFNEGITQPTRIPEMADAVLYAEFVNEMFVRQGKQPRYTDQELQKFKDGSDPFYANTNWYDEVLKKTSSQRQHNLGLTGGTENFSYLISGTYSEQNGIFKNGSTNFKNYSLLSRLDAKINEYIKVGLDISSSIDDSNYPFSTGSIFSGLGMIRPDEPVYWPNGMPSAGIASGNNPAVMVTDAAGNDNQKRKRLALKGSFDIQIPWVTGLGVDGYYYYTDNNYQRKHWQLPWITNSYNRTTGVYNVVTGGGVQKPQLTESNSNGANNLINLRVKYEKQFNNHNINTFIAVEQFQGRSNNFSAFRRDFPSVALDQMFAGSLTGMTANGSASEEARQNLFGRLSYNFREKYLFDFNFRYDGSSNFPKEGRWGFFPGGSVAWNMAEESFIRDNLTFVNNLKLRASYGQIGNDRVPSFQWLSTYTIGTFGYPFGPNAETSLGLRAGVTPNANITWEVSEISNIGLDTRLWNGLLGMSVDVFKQKRSNILAKRDLAVPFNTGLILPNENIGIIENKGAEIDLSHVKIFGDFSYKLGGNFAYVRNKVIDVSEPVGIPEWQKAEGNILGSMVVYKAIGIFRTAEQLAQLPKVPGSVLGDLIYDDLDNDGVITEKDMIRIDKTNIPEITFGFNMAASYKQFSLWAHFAGQARAWRQFHKYSKDGGHNSLKELLENRYTPGSMDSKYPIIPSSETQTMDISGFVSTFWLKDASFLRLKTLELSYSVPSEWLTKIGIGSLKIYVNGNNLFTIDKLEWYDPEGDHLTGSFYPQNKIYNLGVNVSF